MLFDEAEEPSDALARVKGGGGVSTPQTRERYAFLRTKKPGQTCCM
jgi:hypothetical protein